MKSILKRITSLMLSMVLVSSTVLTSLADTPGGSSGAGISAIVPGGKGYLNNPAPIFRDYGFRVTITDSSQLQGII